MSSLHTQLEGVISSQRTSTTGLISVYVECAALISTDVRRVIPLLPGLLPTRVTEVVSEDNWDINGIRMQVDMKDARYNEQLEPQTLVAVFIHAAHMRRVMLPETEDQALCDDVFRDSFGLVFWQGYRRKCQAYYHHFPPCDEKVSMHLLVSRRCRFGAVDDAGL